MLKCFRGIFFFFGNVYWEGVQFPICLAFPVVSLVLCYNASLQVVQKICHCAQLPFCIPGVCSLWSFTLSFSPLFSVFSASFPFFFCVSLGFQGELFRVITFPNSLALCFLNKHNPRSLVHRINLHHFFFYPNSQTSSLIQTLNSCCHLKSDITHKNNSFKLLAVTVIIVYSILLFTSFRKPQCFKLYTSLNYSPERKEKRRWRRKWRHWQQTFNRLYFKHGTKTKRGANTEQTTS